MTEQEALEVSSWQDGHRSHLEHTGLVGEVPVVYAVTGSDTLDLCRCLLGLYTIPGIVQTSE